MRDARMAPPLKTRGGHLIPALNLFKLAPMGQGASTEPNAHNRQYYPAKISQILAPARGTRNCLPLFRAVRCEHGYLRQNQSS